ncbi:inward rectifier K channel (IRK-C) family protein [Achlya hypogyna]|uniref:Inward rectifier K channel (IRK-C) family protein n=1 Tax=Achlya hypogyna TaxID=1202772 RepID=A0A1V9ZR67_ACHHY|nr:inward rectifier K channel (IRK-C) family protein [Achlya hypogyna]
MPSKKRFQRTNGADPAVAIDADFDAPWAHDWPGVRVHAGGSPIFAHPAILPTAEIFPKISTHRNPRRAYKDGIYILLNLPWVQLMPALAAMYFASITLFGVLLFYVCGNSETLSDDFNLSYTTFSTIGFGILFPINRCSNYVIVAEAFVSILSVAALTGLMFAKFAKPKGKIAFSKVAVVHPYGKERLALVVRVANATNSPDVGRDVIMDASFSLTLVRIEADDATGGQRLRYYKLKLLQSNVITFRMVLALVHVIDCDSPLFGLTQASLATIDMILQVGMTGVDSTLQDTVMERQLYSVDMLQWGFRFAEMLHFSDDAVAIHFDDLSKVHSAPIDDNYLVNVTPKVTPTPTPTNVLHGGLHTLSPTPRMAWASSSHKRSSRRLRRPLRASEMEPLYEPLLQADVGTQRIAKTKRRPRQHGAAMPVQQWEVLQHQVAGDSAMPTSTSGLLWNHVNSSQSLFEENSLQVGDDADDDENEVDDDKDLDFSDASSVHSVEIPNTPRFLRITPLHVPSSYSFQSFYYSALHMKWPRIILLIVVGFCVLNLAFAGLLMIDYDGVFVTPSIGDANSPFEICLFMSVQTLATIGYGVIGPQPASYLNNFFVVLESSLGLIFTTIFTGIAWSKFARPRAHIHFSKHIAITTIHGQRCLVLRAANTRHHGDIRESSFRLGVNLTNSKTGLRQMQDVPLVNPEWPSIRIPVTLIHIIDEASPFYQFQTPADFSNYRVSVITLFTGLDTTFTENVYARKMYFWDDFVMDMHFDDCIDVRADGVDVDYTRFDVLLPDHEVTLTVAYWQLIMPPRDDDADCGKRIVVVGMTCAGKSTLAARLAAACAIPVVESDALFWGPAWTAVPAPEYVAAMVAATAKPAWVVAGCNKSAQDHVLARATTAVWLDFPFWTLFQRLVSRTLHRWWTQELVCGANRETLWTHLKLWSPDSLFHFLFFRYWERKRRFSSWFAAHPHLKVVRLTTPEATETWFRAMEARHAGKPL